MSLFAVVATVALGPKMQEGKPKLCSKSPFLSHHFVLKSAQPAARPQNARPGAARRSWLPGQNSERFREVLRLQLLRNSITWFWWDASLGDGTWQLKLTTKKSQKIPLWHSVTKITFVMNRNIQNSMKFDAMNRRICMNRKWPLEIGLSKYVWCQNIWTYLSNPGEKSNSTIDNVATLRTCMLTCASTIARAISARKTHRMEMVWHEVKSIHYKI